MNDFGSREKGFEAKYRVDQEIEFKVIARRNRLLGEWAAEQMGLSGDATVSYAKEVVASNFTKPGGVGVVEKVLADFGDKGIAIDETALRKKMDELRAVARNQLS
jgi:hypothetical protein